MFAVARTRGPVASSAIEAAIHDLDRTIPVFNDRTIEQVMSEASSRRRVAMVVLTVFGGVALLLAAIGVYGVIAQGVAERRREIGVRMALGATSAQVVGLFLRHGLIVIAVGIPIGVAAALVAARSLKSLVFGIGVTDPATLGAVALLLAAIGVYGVIAQGVSERRREIGVRMALGATSGEVVRLFLRHGVVVIAIGIPIGVAAALVAARSLKSLVFGIGVTDPATLGAVVVVLVCVALVASYLPARSAARTDPLNALRAE